MAETLNAVRLIGPIKTLIKTYKKPTELWLPVGKFCYRQLYFSSSDFRGVFVEVSLFKYLQLNEYPNNCLILSSQDCQ